MRPSSRHISAGHCGRFARLLLLSCALCAGCALQKLDVEPGEPLPVVAHDRALPAEAGAELIETALADRADDSRAFALVEAIRSHSSQPLIAGNAVTPLVDGPETFEAITAAVRAARHHVHVETFIFDEDELGRQFAALLREKRGEGVEVRVLYDSVGSMDTAPAFFDELRVAGVEVREFRPMNPVRTPLIWKIHNRDHRKIIVVDGTVGFTGGINISGTYASSSSISPGPERGVDEAWRDTHVRIEGPAVAELQKLFLESWSRAGERTAACCAAQYFPDLQAAGNHLVMIVANDSEDLKDRSLYATYLAAFEHASSRLWITHAYFAPNDALLDAMVEAAKRGVDVRFVAPGFTDSGIILEATRSTFTRLLKAGVRVYELDDALLHAKSVVIDGTVSIVGSANLDMRSFLHNDEVNAIVVSRDFARRMEEIFERDERAAKALDLGTWRKRSLWQRFKEMGSRLLWYWL